MCDAFGTKSETLVLCSLANDAAFEAPHNNALWIPCLSKLMQSLCPTSVRL